MSEADDNIIALCSESPSSTLPLRLAQAVFLERGAGKLDKFLGRVLEK